MIPSGSKLLERCTTLSCDLLPCCVPPPLQKVSIQMIGTPQKVIEGFGPELFGKPLDEDDILEQDEFESDGMLYYRW